MAVDENNLHSKVLIHETDPEAHDTLKNFLDDHQLIGLKPSSILQSLRLNLDLSAVFLCMENDQSGTPIETVILEIFNTRRELPIFLRVSSDEELKALPEVIRQMCTGIYKLQNLSQLGEWIQMYIFHREYPGSFIRHFMQLIDDALKSCFPGMEVSCVKPAYLVRDRLIYGEIFSIISLEASWCRGYLMVQTDYHPLLNLIEAGKTIQPTDDLTQYNVNSLLSEVTNMIWGGFRSKFAVSEEKPQDSHQAEVPIVINHIGKYISFGSIKPQVCFPYSIRDPEGQLPEIILYQKLVFNLGWIPEKFREPPEELDQLLSESAIELF
ncbi:MAG: chemotaxis protein CheX [SAR324 cluster bacterium]|nr:chemotaxis protein CheX [SAR324 cluster bacterium]